MSVIMRFQSTTYIILLIINELRKEMCEFGKIETFGQMAQNKIKL